MFFGTLQKKQIHFPLRPLVLRGNEFVFLQFSKKTLSNSKFHGKLKQKPILFERGELKYYIEFQSAEKTYLVQNVFLR